MLYLGGGVEVGVVGGDAGGGGGGSDGIYLGII